MDEQDRLQGTWNIVSLEVEGTAMPGQAFSGAQIIMTGDRFTTVGMGGVFEGTFAVDTATSPPRMDMVFTAGPHAGQSSPAIYELDGDALTLCLGLAGRERPTTFATSPGSGHALERLKRTSAEPGGAAETPAAQAPAAPTRHSQAADGEAALIQGEWKMVSGTVNGQKVPPDFAATGRRTVTGNRVTVTFGGEVFMDATFTLDDGTEPKQMDYTVNGGQDMGRQQLGIYEVNGNRLRVCIAAPGEPRPTEFASSYGDGRKLTVWQRL